MLLYSSEKTAESHKKHHSIAACLQCMPAGLVKCRHVHGPDWVLLQKHQTNLVSKRDRKVLFITLRTDRDN
ncbi:hypothetical protein RRG08_013980 [Elysia crispata]|uniref:Uncharacterized protein n=1 Tax=Elysia crispata TaxID=231223 RepID=A0AAE0Z5H0_9GAST|nr:hypothetical protein RRG08_013980 [Elysia crispata]